MIGLGDIKAEEHIRLECLKLAVEHGVSQRAQDRINLATKFETYVVTGKVPDMKTED